MSNVQIEIEGLDKAMSRFEKMTPAIARSLQKSIYQAAYFLEGKAKYALTVGETRAIKSGTLRSNTVVRTLTPTTATIGPTVHYAIFVHEGTRFMSPRPFLRVAAEQSKEDVTKLFLDNIKDSI